MSFHSTLWTTSLRKRIHVSLFIGRCLRTVCNSFQCTNQQIYCNQIYALLCTVSMAPVWYQVIPSISSPRLAWSVYSPCCKGSFGLFRSDDSNTDLERNWKTWPQYKSDLRCLLRCKVSRFQALEEWHRQPFRFLPSRNQDQKLLPSQANTRKATVDILRIIPSTLHDNASWCFSVESLGHWHHIAFKFSDRFPADTVCQESNTSSNKTRTTCRACCKPLEGKESHKRSRFMVIMHIPCFKSCMERISHQRKQSHARRRN